MIIDISQTIEVGVLTDLSKQSSFHDIDQTRSDIFTVRTPKFYYFDAKGMNQVQECLLNGIDLKEYALKHYNGPTHEALQPQYHGTGKALGRWLNSFAAWSVQQSQLRQLVAQKHLRARRQAYAEFLMAFRTRKRVSSHSQRCEGYPRTGREDGGGRATE